MLNVPSDCVQPLEHAMGSVPDSLASP
jgi:hypothetical protein